MALDRLAALVSQLEPPPPGVRRSRPLTVAAGPLAVVDDANAARDIAASCIAWYACAMGDVYAQSLARQGFDAEVRAVRAANPRPSPRNGRIPAAAQRLLDQLAAGGSPEHVRAQLERWDGVADIVMVGLPPGLPWAALERTLRAAAPVAAATADLEPAMASSSQARGQAQS